MSTQDCTSLDFESLGLLPKSDREDSPDSAHLVILSGEIHLQERKVISSLEFKRRSHHFHVARSPSTSIRLFLERIYKYSGCSAYCFVIAYVYINRFLHRTQGLLITSTLIASKFIDDTGYDTVYFVKVGRISTAEINRLEMNFLFNINFRLLVRVEIFEDCCLQLEMESNGGHHRVDPSTKIIGIRECWPRREDPKRSTTTSGFSCKAM